LEAIDRWVLVEPIEEEYLKSSSIVLLDTKKKSDKYYRVKLVKPNEDVQVGEVIITKPNCVKKISVNGSVEHMVYMEHVYGKRIV
jgi:ribulose bisphosphate carboxylase small subunit